MNVNTSKKSFVLNSIKVIKKLLLRKPTKTVVVINLQVQGQKATVNTLCCFDYTLLLKGLGGLRRRTAFSTQGCKWIIKYNHIRIVLYS